MAFLQLNWVAVLISAIVGYAIGAVWFSPALFGKAWMRLSNKSERDMEKAKQKGMGKVYAITFISTLVMAIVLAFLLSILGGDSLIEGAFTGFLLWLGFVATVQLSMVLWDGKPFQLYAITTAHELVVLVVMGVILGIWG
ncbi:DUF1761 domain-containing protein [Candidatus Woesearchaeota archaeon]|nr:DUF1761 domain-containing protein [Candidatus Woesearchaeota archaeon]